MFETIVEKFDISGKLVNLEKKDIGHINNTYVATYKNKIGEKTRYLIQGINANVFEDPKALMRNIEQVTSFLKDKIDEKHKTLEIIKTKSEENLLIINKSDNEREYYRAYKFIENTITCNRGYNKKIVFNAGKGFGNFQKLLSDFPMDTLAETIKDFHNTPKRLRNFLKDIEKVEPERVNNIKEEINFILQRQEILSLIIDKLENGEIPYRVAHNDTKIDNIMFDVNTNEYVAVIDLDTVMKGSILYDYGDGIRSSAKDISEGEIFFNKETFEAYTDGFLSETAKILTEEEIKLMGQSIRIISLELAIRYLSDYINQNIYFKTTTKDASLDRAKNLIELVKCIEKDFVYINEYILRSYSKYKNIK